MANGVNNQESLLSKAGGALVFPGVIQAGKTASYVIKNAKIGRNPIKALKSDMEAFKTLKGSLKGDIFTRGKILKEAYDDYKTVLANAGKAKNPELVKEFLSGKNLEKYTSKSAEVAKSLEGKSKISSVIDSAFGEQIAKRAEKKAGKQAAETAGKKGIGTFLGKHFPTILNAAFVALDIFSKKDEIKDSYNKEGLKGGIKKTLQIAVPSVANLVGFEAGGALGGAIGAAVGSVVPVIGTGIGALFGNMIGGMIAGGAAQKVTEKVVGYHEPDKEETPQENQEIQNNQDNNIQDTQQIQEQTAQNNKLDIIDTQSKSAYQKPVNGVYKTDWVNQAAQNGTLEAEGKKRGYLA